MSYWGDVIALAPLILLKLNEMSGTAAADSSGNGHGGTYTNAPTLNQQSLITNVSSDKGPYFAGGAGGGSNGWVSDADQTDVGAADVTFCAWIKPEALDSQREVMGKPEHAQLWLNADGTLIFYVTPAWSSVSTTSTYALVAGNVYFVCARKRAGYISIWINGIKRAEAAHAAALTAQTGYTWRFGTSSVGPRYFRGWAQGFGVWTATSLTDAQILSLYNSGVAAPNDPPTAPGSITAPTAGQSVDASINVTWTAATDPESDPLQYEGSYSLDNGATWAALFSLQSGLLYAWNTAALAETVTAKVRVRAYDGSQYGPYATSPAFTIYHNRAPAAPGIFTHPLTGESFDNSIAAAWGAAVDPEGDPLQYYGEYSADDGATWAMAFTWQSATSAVIDSSGWVYGVIYKLRVKAKDPAGLLSPWTTSGDFTISHVSAPPNAPVVAVLARSDYSVHLWVANYADIDIGIKGEHYATQWQVDLLAGDFSAPVVDTGWLVAPIYLMQRWITGLPGNTSFKARARFRDRGGQIGAWGGATTFKSRRLHPLGNPAGFVPQNLGSAPEIVGEYGHSFNGNDWLPGPYPELTLPLEENGALVHDRGIRMRMSQTLGDYSQAAPSGVEVLVRYVDARIADTNVYDVGTYQANAGPVSFVLVLRPEVVSDAPLYYGVRGYEILGGKEDLWWLYHRNGNLGFEAVDGVAWFPGVNGVLLDQQPNLIIFSYLRKIYDDHCMLATTDFEARVLRPGWINLYTNGVKSAGGFQTKLVGACPALSNAVQSMAIYFGDHLFLGKHCGVGNRNNDGTANGLPYAGVASELAWWTNHAITDTEAASMYAAFAAGNMDLFASIISALNPLVYDRYSQPRQPSKSRLLVTT